MNTPGMECLSAAPRKLDLEMGDDDDPHTHGAQYCNNFFQCFPKDFVSWTVKNGTQKNYIGKRFLSCNRHLLFHE